uniref:Uncharacterized protein n=1 Tax=Fagus sylvatica TaxID=28930 RepID=A0A2N9HYR7_FAGSY
MSTPGASCKRIQFGTLEPVCLPCLESQEDADIEDKPSSEGEGWTLVTHRKSRKQHNPKPRVTYARERCQMRHDEISLEDPRLSVAATAKPHVASKGGSPILRYVPLSKRKKGQTPFGLVAEAKFKLNEPAQEKDIAILKSNLTLPLPRLDKVASTKPPLKGFVKSASDSIKEGSLPDKRTNEGFDPKAYRLLAKSGYDFNNPSQLGQLYSDCVERKSQGLNQT